VNWKINRVLHSLLSFSSLPILKSTLLFVRFLCYAFLSLSFFFLASLFALVVRLCFFSLSLSISFLFFLLFMIYSFYFSCLSKSVGKVL